jgi:hypothetical protein
MVFTRDEALRLKEAAEREFGKLPGIRGLGIGERCLRVYVVSDAAKRLLPATFQGVSIEVVVVGDVTAQRSVGGR